MNKQNIFIGVVAVIALLLSLVGLASSSEQPVSLGGTTNYDTVSVTGLKVGVGCADSNTSCAGSSVTSIIKGTCNLVGGTIAATSSAVADCAVTGVLDGDLVFATLATSTANAVIDGARASSTSGFITVRLHNLTGAASSVSALGSSTAYFVIR